MGNELNSRVLSEFDGDRCLLNLATLPFGTFGSFSVRDDGEEVEQDELVVMLSRLVSEGLLLVGSGRDSFNRRVYRLALRGYERVKNIRLYDERRIVKY